MMTQRESRDAEAKMHSRLVDSTRVAYCIRLDNMHIVCILESVDIEFDPVKAKANLAKHKVSFAHAEQARIPTHKGSRAT